MMDARYCILAAAALAAVAATAETDKIVSAYAGMTKEQREAAKAERAIQMLKEDGGDIALPGTMKGSIVFVNAQKRTDFDAAKLLKLFTDTFHYNAKVVSGEAVTPATATVAREKTGANLALFVVDDPSLGMMLTAPEECWAIVNVARLAADNPKPTFLSARTRKEIIRAFAFLTAGSTYDAPLMGVVRKPADLDNIARERYPIDVVMRFHKHLTRLGVTECEYETYRNALAAGFKIAPTNDFQKAIYEELSAKQKAK